MSNPPVTTKWQEFLDKPKGALSYNPSQISALQVFWVVRSPKAAEEMIEKGFAPCSAACQRDTPTTLCYLFRKSHNQKLAHEFRSQITTIGQHPHYQAIFRSLEMGLPRQSQENKLRIGGIDPTPLEMSKETPLTPELAEKLDFDPVVLECTEIYLDNQSFYEHVASQDWMKHSQEILKPCRSLKPTTYCLGTPDDKIWESAIEGPLKAIRFDREREWTRCLRPGIFVTPMQPDEKQFEPVFFLELDGVIDLEAKDIENWRNSLDTFQQSQCIRFMMILPTNLNEEMKPTIEFRIMLGFSLVQEKLHVFASELEKTMKHLSVEGRLIVFGADKSTGEILVDASGLKRVTVEEAQELKEQKALAGYAIHPLFKHLYIDANKHYEV